MASVNIKHGLQISDGLTPEQRKTIEEQLSKLTQDGWELWGDGRGIKKTFHIGGWVKPWELANSVALQAISRKHHPEINVTYGAVSFIWTTHNPAGLSNKDVELATITERRGRMIQQEIDHGPFDAHKHT